MCRADDAGSLIGEQHRRAIGGENAERDAFALRHHRIGFRPLALRPGFLDHDDIGAVHLMAGDERVGPDAQLRHAHGGDSP